MESIRIDKWLWAVRLFKTRNQAADACRAGKIKINGMPVKPSREILTGDVITVQDNPIAKTVEVKIVIKNRVGAKLVSENMIDHTPKEEYDKQKMMHEMNYERRDRGAGRPTKKERRTITKLKNNKI